MPPVVPFLAAIGTALTVGAATGALAAVIGGAFLFGIGALSYMASTMKVDYAKPDNDKSRQSTVKSTVEPQKIIYGEALVSGPITFVGVSGSNNEVMHHVIALAGHEVEAITDIWLDDQITLNNQFNEVGEVIGGTFQGIMTVTKFRGTEVQGADTNLLLLYPEYTAAHKGIGIAYIHTQFVLNDESQEIWDKYSPNNIKALVRGRKIYDPRLDVTPGANPTNSAYIAYSDNPALAVADYLINTRFGMKINPDKIDWATVIVSANACDVLVDIPNSLQEKRFTANGALFATDSHKASIDKLLSAMNGKLIYSSGFYYIKAGIYEAPTESLNEIDLTDAISVKTSVERSKRFNTVGGVFLDPAQLHKTSEFPKVTITSALLRDNNEVLEREIELPFTNSLYMAQRLANKLVQLSDQQKLVNFPANLAGLRVAVGDRVSVSIDELGWDGKVFQCLGWSFNDGGDSGVSLTLQEDDAGSYADMLPADYSTVSADGVITDGFPGVPDPQGLTATAGLRSIDLNWRNPINTTKFKEIAIYASPDSSWANKVEIGRTMGTQFFHDASTALDSLAVGDTRYYWVRALQYGTGTDSSAVSDRNPDNDTSNIFATVGANIADSVEWIDVANFNNLRPDDNATVGATAGTNLTDSVGAVLGDDDVLNSVVIEDITEIQLAGTGEILELIGGARADLQQLGDVAAYAFNNGQYLLGITNDLDASFGNLQQTVVDITAGTTDVFVSDEPPVAGVGGVPDPIDIYSRWYDSNDNNKPYYWNGTTWVDLSDPRIASNQSEITAVSANLDGTITTVDGHTTQISATTSAVSVLDATVVLIDEDLVALTGSYDAFVLAYEQSDPNAQIAVNAAAIDTLELQVEVIDGLIEVSATDITELNVEMKFYTKLDAVDGETLQLVNGDEIDLQGTSAVGGATGTAVSILDTRIVETERGISVVSQDIVSLTSALNDTNLNLEGEANAISNLSTIVEIQGDVITATSSDIVLLTARVGDNEGEISQLNTVTAGSTSLLVQSFLELTGTVGDAQGDITQLNTVDLSSTSALVQAHLTLSGSVGDAQGDIVQINTVDVTSTSALVQDFLTLSGAVDDAEGEIVQLNTVTVDSTSALVQAYLTLEGSVGDAEGEIVQLNTVTVDSTSALVQAHLAVSSTVGDNTSSISTQLESIDGIEANYGVKVDINGRITGFGLNSTAKDATPTSEFYVIADKFAVVDPASTESTPIVPFVISDDLITMGANVRINGDLVTAGTIDADRIDVAGVITAGSIVIGTDIADFIDGTQVNENVTSISGSVITTGTIIADKIILDGTTLTATGDSLGIKDGGVNTTQVTANAITSGSTSFTEAATGLTLLQEITITTSTAVSSVEIFAQGYIGIVGAGGGGDFVYLNLYRDATLLKTVTIQAQTDRSVYDTSTIIYLDTPSAAGTYTYKLTRTGYAANVSDRYISVREFKR